MNDIKIVCMVLAGAAGGYMVPDIAQKLIVHKARQKNIEIQEQPQYLSVFCKMLCAALSTAGLGLCASKHTSWLTLLLVTSIWLIGAVVFIVDMRIRIIANETVLALGILGLGFRISMDGIFSISNSIITMAVVMGVWIVFRSIIGVDKFGAGDVKLCSVMGIMFGYPNVLCPVAVMSLLLFMFCLIGLMLNKITIKSRIPMAPFIILGMMTGILFYFI